MTITLTETKGLWKPMRYSGRVIKVSDADKMETVIVYFHRVLKEIIAVGNGRTRQIVLYNVAKY